MFFSNNKQNTLELIKKYQKKISHGMTTDNYTKPNEVFQELLRHYVGEASSIKPKKSVYGMTRNYTKLAQNLIAAIEQQPNLNLVLALESQLNQHEEN